MPRLAAATAAATATTSSAPPLLPLASSCARSALFRRVLALRADQRVLLRGLRLPALAEQALPLARERGLLSAVVLRGLAHLPRQLLLLRGAAVVSAGGLAPEELLRKAPKHVVLSMEFDMSRWQQDEYAAKLHGCGVLADYVLLPGAIHTDAMPFNAKFLAIYKQAFQLYG